MAFVPSFTPYSLPTTSTVFRVRFSKNPLLFGSGSMTSSSSSSFSSSFSSSSFLPSIPFSSSSKYQLRSTSVSFIPVISMSSSSSSSSKSRIGLIGLAVMGQNLALNFASKGIPISVFNRTASKTDDTVARAAQPAERIHPGTLRGFHDLKDFVDSLESPRKIIIMVKAGKPVDATIDTLKPLLHKGDLIIDGGNEWYENTIRRAQSLAPLGLRFMGCGVSGGEEGARNGPSLMPGGEPEAWDMVGKLLESIAANVDPKDGPCVFHIGPQGAGNYVKMIHNGIEYGDMQLIGEAYDVLRTLGGLDNKTIAGIFNDWNKAELESFLIEITASILDTQDDLVNDGSALVEKILDQSGSKGTGMWTIEEAARRAVPAPTIAGSLDGRYLSSMKQQRVHAAKILKGPSPQKIADVDTNTLVAQVRRALYASKICSYAQGMNIIKQAATDNGWDLDLGNIARIWKGGCIIRAIFLDRIKSAYVKDKALASLLIDPEFAKELADAQDAWRSVASLAIKYGVAAPSITASLAYYDAYRRDTLPSSQLVQAQRDFFGAHTYQRLDIDGTYHTRWSSDKKTVKADEH